MMNIPATLEEINALSLEERIYLVQAIWDGIAAEQTFLELNDAQKQELDRRVEASEQNPDDVLTWDEIRASIRERR